jgi:hypothetical protein
MTIGLAKPNAAEFNGVLRVLSAGQSSHGILMSWCVLIDEPRGSGANRAVSDLRVKVPSR